MKKKHSCAVKKSKYWRITIVHFPLHFSILYFTSHLPNNGLQLFSKTKQKLKKEKKSVIKKIHQL